MGHERLHPWPPSPMPQHRHGAILARAPSQAYGRGVAAAKARRQPPSLRYRRPAALSAAVS